MNEWAYLGNSEIEIYLTKKDVKNGLHSGPCDDDIAKIIKKPYIKKQFNKITDNSLIATLQEYGAWDIDELQDRQQNSARIVWIACGDIQEDKRMQMIL